MLPGNLRQFTQSFQLAKLPHRLRRQSIRPEPIAEAERHIVRLHNLADFFKMGVEEILAMMRNHHLP
jgi:hypothetical protein